ncbi:MAG: low-complexity tail membrane protein [Nodosilinea sp.]
MAPWRCDPYLWVHLAGLATVPLWIDLCLMGLAVGTPTLPGLELGVMVLLGVLPVLVMQLRRPFYIFSLPGIALRPTALSDDQRRLLNQFRQWRVRLGALLVPVPLVWLLVKLYPLAFLAHDITPFSDWGRLSGLAIALVSFCLANLFLQVPVAALQVLTTPDRHMAAVLPYPTEAVAANFSWLGLSVSKLLPSLAPQDTIPQAEPSREADQEDVRSAHQSLDYQDPERLSLDPQAVVIERLGEDAGEGTDDAKTDDPMATEYSGRNGSALGHPEVDDLEEVSPSPELGSQSELWPVTPTLIPELSRRTSRHP